MNKKHIYSLTSLRFFAAAGVFLHHLGVLKTVDNKLISEAARYFFSGYAGVTFFYILSGFIISFSYDKHKKDGLFDSKDFIFFRVCRIFPVHIMTLLISLLIFSTGLEYGAENIIKLLLNLSLIHAFIPLDDIYFSFNTVSWSLSCELFFYCSFIFLVALKSRILIAILISILFLQLLFIFNPQSSIDDHWLFYINPAFRIIGFIIGMLLFRFHDQIKVHPKYGVCSLLEIMSFLFLLFTVYISTNFVSNMSLRYDLIFLPSMALMVFIFSFDNGVISKILSNRLLIFLGEASFSFYMIHLMIIRVVFKIGAGDAILDTKNILILSVFAFLLSVLCSFLLFNFFELPVNKKLRSLWLKFRY